MTSFSSRITTRQTLLDFPSQCPYLAAITCTARAHSFQTPTRPTFFNMADFLPFSTNQKPENSRGVYANELAKILPNERTVLLMYHSDTVMRIHPHSDEDPSPPTHTHTHTHTQLQVPDTGLAPQA